MEDVVMILVLALAGGMLAGLVRLPPLVGFLVAGFVLNALGVEEPANLDVIAELGVTVLLFGIGLKLDPRTLVRREVWVTATMHLVVSTVIASAALAGLAVLGIGLLSGSDARTLVLVGFALSFSSTVFAVKALEEHSATQSLAGRTAIGILIVQDLAAVIFLTLTHDEPPSPWIALLILLVPGTWLLRRTPDLLGHDELRPLFGLALALVPGYALFEAVGLKGDLGALVVGILMASHPGSAQLAKSLFVVKDLLLVAFFVSIGFIGLPTAEHLLLAGVLLLLLPLKALGFTALLWAHGLRRRTSVLAGTTLANYSEFGLIVTVASAAVLDEGWLVVLATAIAASFVLSAVFDQAPDLMTAAARRLFVERPPDRLHPEDRPIDVGHSHAVVLGMGRVGRAAYQRLEEGYGLTVVGVETDRVRVERLISQGVDVVEGDATDPDFWARLRTGEIALVVLAMPFHGNNLDALERLETSGFAGTVAVVAQYDDDLEQARRHGAHTGFQLYDGAGTELADRAASAAGFGHDRGDLADE